MSSGVLTDPLSSPLRSALSSAFAVRRGGSAPAFDPATLFASGELGAFFDRRDTALMATGGNFDSVTAAGQLVTAAANKRVAPTVLTALPAMTCSASVSQAGNILTFASSPSGHQAQGPSVNGAAFYRMSFVVTGAGSVTVYVGAVPKSYGPGTHVLQGWHAFGAGFFIFRVNAGGFNGTVEFVERQEFVSSSSQASTSLQPAYQISPPRVVFDGVDDVHVVNFSTSLGSNCTIGRSVPGVGAQILTGQTIGSSYSINTTDSGLVIINRALTGPETAGLTSYLEDAAFF
jgi:hypothetical protein